MRSKTKTDNNSFVDNTNNTKTLHLRRCIGCMNMYPKISLLRIVRNTADFDVLIDLDQNKNGRGAYICKNENCFNMAIKKKAFSHTLKCNIPESFTCNLQNIILEEQSKIK